MFTKERDGGNMSKNIEKIVINTESIDVISNTNGVNNVMQFNLETEGNEAKEIFEKYNLSSLTNYPFDIKVVRALSENEDQLKDYLETCRRANYSKEKVEIPDSIPEIEYDLRELKDGFTEIEDENLRKSSQIEMYRQAKETQSQLRGKVTIKMGLLDRTYFAVQEFLSNRNKTLALMEGQVETRRSIRDELRDNNLREKTDQVSREFAKNATPINTQTRENEEISK